MGYIDKWSHGAARYQGSEIGGENQKLGISNPDMMPFLASPLFGDGAPLPS